jgi:hypothetical protein
MISALAAGVVGGLALLALLAAAYIFYRRNDGGKEDGFKTIARRVLARGHVHWRPCRTRTLLRPSSPSISPSRRPAAVHCTSAYEPGWSPEEMLSDMRGVEAAAGGLVAALSSNPDARGRSRCCNRWPVQQRLLVAALPSEPVCDDVNHCRHHPPPPPNQTP